MKTLTLPLKATYFDQIAAGTKPEEFRLATAYWRKRLAGRTYDHIVLTKGYPPAGDTARRMELPWRGCRLTTITDEFFGQDPVEVFAIAVSAPSPITFVDDDGDADEDADEQNPMEARSAIRAENVRLAQAAAPTASDVSTYSKPDRAPGEDGFPYG